MTPIVIFGPQGCGKSTHAEALATHFGCVRVVDDWDGCALIRPGDLVLTHLPAAMEVAERCGCMGLPFDEAMAAAGLTTPAAAL